MSKQIKGIHLFIILFSALVIRVFFLSASHFHIHSDHATWALMALDFLKGNFYFFPAGQTFGSPLEPFCMIPFFKIIGSNHYAVRALGFGISIGIILAHYGMIRTMFHRRIALLSAWYFALGPQFLIEWTLEVRGGRSPTLIFGPLILLAGFFILRCPEQKKRRLIFLYAWCGFISGVGYTNDMLAFTYIGTFLLCACLQDFRRMVKHLVFFLFPFFILYLPHFFYNITTGASTYAHFFGMMKLYNLKFVPLRIFHMLAESFPVLIGARISHSFQDFFPFLSIPVSVLFVVLFFRMGKLFFAHISRITPWTKIPRARITQCSKLLVLKNNFIDAVRNADPVAYAFVFLIVHCGFFLASNSGDLITHSPRYLLPLYSVLVPLFFFFLFQFRARIIRFLVCGFVFLLNLGSIFVYAQECSLPGTQRGQWTADFLDQKMITETLLSRDIHQLYADYWICYTVGFLSQGQILVSPLCGPNREDRRPWDTKTIQQTKVPKAVIFSMEAAYEESGFLDFIRNIQTPYVRIDFGRFHVYLTKAIICFSEKGVPYVCGTDD